MQDTVKQAREEMPVGPLAQEARFGSDVIADALRSLDVPYIALNPGASYRGLHDSLVNYLGNASPQMLVCLHEEHAVGIAHGYAKVTGRAMAAGLHANVGLMHATMAIFDAWCDRAPVLLLGATGPVDAAHRRPWIDWIHTARDQGALVRHYTKWDDQPASPAAAQEALARGKWLAETLPCGPVYINVDAGMQEAALDGPAPSYDFARHMPKIRQSVSAADIERLADLLADAKRPLILAGRASRDREAWDLRVALAEQLGARVVTDIKIAASFPLGHPLNGAAPGAFPTGDAVALLEEADLILSLDWVDLAGTLAAARPSAGCRIVHVSLDYTIHNGWSMDHLALPAVDVMIPAGPDAILGDLASELRSRNFEPKVWGAPNPMAVPHVADVDEGGELVIANLVEGLREALGGRSASLSHVPLSWEGRFWSFNDPLDYTGSEGGGGIGAGPGIAVGAALALRDLGSDRLPIVICGDGDFIMGCTAIWTAVRYHIPLLVIVANNRSFYNDEVHQERVAIARGRPVANKWIGQKMIEPEIDISSLGAAQGARGFGPVRDRADMMNAYAEAISIVEAGGVAIVDVHIKPGYPPSASVKRAE